MGSALSVPLNKLYVNELGRIWADEPGRSSYGRAVYELGWTSRVGRAGLDDLGSTS